MAENPYATPEATLEPGGTTAEAESIRREHINHETSVRSIGLLYYLTAAMLLLGAVTGLTGLSTGRMEIAVGMGVFMLALTAGMFTVGRGLRMLKRWARIPTIVLSIFGLLGFPVGTVVNVYILYLVFCKKGRRVFADDYQGIIADTPQVRYKTSIVVWIVLGLLVAGFLAAILVPLMSR